MDKVKGFGLICGMVLASVAFIGMGVFLKNMHDDISDLQAQNADVTSQLYLVSTANYHLSQDVAALKKSPGQNYPVGLAQNVLELQQKVTDIQSQEQVNNQVLDNVFRNREPWFGLQAAAVLWNNGDTASAKAVGVYAMSQLVGQKNFGCSKTPLTDPMYLYVDLNILAKILENSPYSIRIVETVNGVSKITIAVDKWIPGC